FVQQVKLGTTTASSTTGTATTTTGTYQNNLNLGTATVAQQKTQATSLANTATAVVNPVPVTTGTTNASIAYGVFDGLDEAALRQLRSTAANSSKEVENNNQRNVMTEEWRDAYSTPWDDGDFIGGIIASGDQEAINQLIDMGMVSREEAALITSNINAGKMGGGDGNAENWDNNGLGNDGGGGDYTTTDDAFVIGFDDVGPNTKKDIYSTTGISNQALIAAMAVPTPFGTFVMVPVVVPGRTTLNTGYSSYSVSFNGIDISSAVNGLSLLLTNPLQALNNFSMNVFGVDFRSSNPANIGSNVLITPINQQTGATVTTTPINQQTGATVTTTPINQQTDATVTTTPINQQTGPQVLVSPNQLDQFGNNIVISQNNGASENLANVNGGRAPFSELNGSLGELNGYNQALGEGRIGIIEPGKTSAPGVDYATYNPDTGVVYVTDAKYRGPGGTYPTSVSSESLEKWTEEVKSTVQSWPDSTLKTDILNAIDNGKVKPEIFKWPK
ncbi:hypothetical protein, partial [Undibacterium sp. Ji49W]|uniref:hypothetical protein n=1 Tax=Undibacterium sp. Ji49W TaxID=3413040 RepID=UPI003BF3C15C